MCDSLFKRAINFLGCKIPKKCTFFGVVKKKIYIYIYIQNYPVNIGAKNSKTPCPIIIKTNLQCRTAGLGTNRWQFSVPPKKMTCHWNATIQRHWHVHQHPCVALLTSPSPLSRRWNNAVPSWTSRSKVCRCALTCGSAMTASSAFLMRKALWTQTGRQIGKKSSKERRNK